MHVSEVNGVKQDTLGLVFGVTSRTGETALVPLTQSFGLDGPEDRLYGHSGALFSVWCVFGR